MTYLLASDLGRVRVRLGPDGRPTGFVWRQRFHAVREVLNTWRIHDGWWSQPIWRDYYAVATETGWQAVLYYELHERQWYLERLRD